MTSITRAHRHPCGYIEVWLTSDPDFPHYADPANGQSWLDRALAQWLAAGNELTPMPEQAELGVVAAALAYEEEPTNHG